jgi:hypothetical protein
MWLEQWKEGDEAPYYEPGLCLIETGFHVTDKQLLGFCAGHVLLAMGENDRIDSLAATDATPIDRPDFEYPLLHHEPTAAVATIGPSLLFADGQT